MSKLLCYYHGLFIWFGRLGLDLTYGHLLTVYLILFLRPLALTLYYRKASCCDDSENRQWHWIWFPTVFYIAHKLHQCHHFPILMQISLYLTTNLHSTSLLQWFWLQWSPGPYHCNLAPLSFVPHVHFPSGIHHIPFQDHSIQAENATSIEIQAHGY